MFQKSFQQGVKHREPSKAERFGSFSKDIHVFYIPHDLFLPPVRQVTKTNHPAEAPQSNYRTPLLRFTTDSCSPVGKFADP